MRSRRWSPGVVLLIAAIAGDARPAGATSPFIPAFARKFRTGCTTCHTAPPKLNVLGEAFRLNGYRLPDNPALVRREPPVPLGEEPWKDLWPRTIWPGELPASAPVALRVQSDALARRVAPGGERVRLLMPNDVYLLAGATFGGGISAFAEAEWEHEGGVELVQAKVLFQDPLPWLPSRSLNVMAGRQDLHLLTFGDRILDRSGRRPFAWQTFRPSGVSLDGQAGDGEWQLGDAMPAISANGLFGGRFFYSGGVAQVASEGDDEDGRPLAAFYTLRFKWGGLRLDGRYDPDGGPGARGYGQLLDRAVVLETFGFRGTEALNDGGRSRQRALGAALRLLDGPVDLGMGYVRRTDTGAWGTDRSVRVSSVFAKGEYLVFPWLIGSLKGERLRVPQAEGTVDDDPGETTVVPGVVMLVRQNMRLVVEGELFARHAASTLAGRRRPHGVAMRLDFAF